MRYPNGKTYQKKENLEQNKSSAHRTLLSAANRGMSLEEDINLSNDFYRDSGSALINKRPTPINIVKVDYSRGARITDKGRYIDFEAKNTKSTTSFPLSNISEHQIVHLKNVLKHGGIAFFIISFQMKDEIYLLDASFVIDFYEHGKRKSIPYEVFTQEGILIKQDYSPRLHYLDAVDALYFK